MATNRQLDANRSYHRWSVEMTPGLIITIVDPDEDYRGYLGIEVQAFNGRFAGSTHVYAGVRELSQFADDIRGFPKYGQDQRTHEFGSRDRLSASGYCSIELQCLDRAGHVGVYVKLEDDDRPDPATARFSFQTEAAAIDRFVEEICVVESERRGSATLPVAH